MGKTNKRALVSCIITTFNRSPAVLKRALKSVCSQTYKNIEIIVVNDNPRASALSSDIRTMIKTSFGDEVRLIEYEENRGACVARNTGIQNSNGEFVAFLDDDDEWLPTKIEKQMSLFNDGVVMVYCNRMNYYEETQKRHIVKNPGFSGMIYEELMKDNFIGSTSYPLIERKSLCEVGGFDTEMDSLQDHDLWARLSLVGKISYLPEPLAIFHVYSAERISNNPQKAISGRERFIIKNDAYYSSHRRILGYRYATIAHFFAKDGQTREAFKKLFLGITMNPWAFKTNLYEFAHVCSSILKRRRG